MIKKNTSHVSQEFAEIGKMLEEARKEKGLSIEKVAARINVRKLYLRAIEAGDLAALPGGIYTVGFIKVYSKFLGLDADEFVRRVKADEIPMRRTEQPSFQPERLAEIFNESNLPSKKTIIISGAGFCLIILAVVGWSLVPKPFISTNIESESAFEVVDTTKPPKVDHNTSALGVAPPADVPGTVTDIESGTNRGRLWPNKADTTQNTENIGSQKAVEQAENTTSSAQSATAEQPSGGNTAGNISIGTSEQPPGFFQPADASTSVSGEQPADSGTAEVASAPGQTVLKATQASWVRIRDKQNQIIFTKTLQPGEEFIVPSQEGLTLHTGNAGGLDVFIGGERLGPLGAPAQIIRKVDLSSQALKQRINPSE